MAAQPGCGKIALGPISNISLHVRVGSWLCKNAAPSDDDRINVLSNCVYMLEGS